MITYGQSVVFHYTFYIIHSLNTTCPQLYARRPFADILFMTLQIKLPINQQLIFLVRHLAYEYVVHTQPCLIYATQLFPHRLSQLAET